MGAEEKVKNIYPEAWYRIGGPHYRLILTSAKEDRRILAESWRGGGEKQLWAQAWRNIQAGKVRAALAKAKG